MSNPYQLLCNFVTRARRGTDSSNSKRRGANLVYHTIITRDSMMRLIADVKKCQGGVGCVVMVHPNGTLPPGFRGRPLWRFWGDGVEIITVSQLYRLGKYPPETIYIVLGLGRGLYEVDELLHNPRGAYLIFPTPVNRDDLAGHFTSVPMNITTFRAEKTPHDLMNLAGGLTGDVVIYVAKREVRVWKTHLPDAVNLADSGERRLLDNEPSRPRRYLLQEGFEYLLPIVPRVGRGGKIIYPRLTVVDTELHDVRWFAPAKGDRRASHYRRAMLRASGGTVVTATWPDRIRWSGPATMLSDAFLVLFARSPRLRDVISERVSAEIRAAEQRFRISRLPRNFLDLQMPPHCHALLRLWMRNRLPEFPSLVAAGLLMERSFLFSVNDPNEYIDGAVGSTPLETALRVWDDSWKYLGNLNFPRNRGGYKSNLRGWAEARGVNADKLIALYEIVMRMGDWVNASYVPMDFRDWVDNLDYHFSVLFSSNVLTHVAGEEYRGVVPRALLTSTHAMTSLGGMVNYHLPHLPQGVYSETPPEIVPLQVDQFAMLALAARYVRSIPPAPETVLTVVNNPRILEQRLRIAHRGQQRLEADYSAAPPFVVPPPPPTPILSIYELPPQTVLHPRLRPT